MTDAADESSRVVVAEPADVRWHWGAARLVSVHLTSTTGVTGAAATFSANDINHTVTATGINQTCTKLAPRAFIKTQTGGTTAVLSVAAAPVNVASHAILSVSTLVGKNFITTPGVGGFVPCDAGRNFTVPGTGLTTAVKILAVLNANIATISANATVASTSTRTLGPLTVSLQINNSNGRSTQTSSFSSGSATLTDTTANFSGGIGCAFPCSSVAVDGDVGLTVSGQCIPEGTTILTVTNATTVTMSHNANCNAATHSATLTPDGIGLNTVSTSTPLFQSADEGKVITGCSADFSGAIAVGKVIDSTHADIRDTLFGAGVNATAVTPCTAAVAVASKNFANLDINTPDGATSTARLVNDANTSVANHVTSNTAQFLASDLGLPIKILTITRTISAVNSATDVTVSGAGAFAAGTNKAAFIGTPSGTAPANGDVVAEQNNALDLMGSLSPGAAACADPGKHLTGAPVNGQWYNPGSFISVLGSSAIPAPENSVLPTGAIIGQIAFGTSVTSWGAFVVQRPASFVEEDGSASPVAAAHTEIVYPFQPLGIAVCPGSPVTLGWSFRGASPTTYAYPTGWGQPSSAFVHALRPLAPGAEQIAGQYTVGTPQVMEGFGVSDVVLPGDSGCIANENTTIDAGSSGFNCGF